MERTLDHNECIVLYFITLEELFEISLTGCKSNTVVYRLTIVSFHH